jgi:hypothetical protein
MKPILSVIAIAALALPTAAVGKGPSEASINGPGTGGGISIGKDDRSGGGWLLGDLTRQAGFSPAVFPQQPNPMLRSRPKGDLGPKYTIMYAVPGPNGEMFTLRQDVYPYATPSPVTYMTPGQKVFRIQTRGGWYVADSRLKNTLVRAGLPKIAPTGSARGGDGFFSTGVASAMAGALALLLAGSMVVFMRRRGRPAAAA